MKRKPIAIVSAVILFLLALGMTLYPVISNHINQKYASQIHTAYQEVMQQTDNSALLEARQLAIDYNEGIVPGASEVDSYSQESLMAASEDYENLLNITGEGTMCYVKIPKINVNLPVYHGTGNDSLDRGVGHLLGSSLPVGGENTHAILTGHSGMASQKMFTDLELLEIGDVFYVDVLNETLAYQVEAINVVEPHDTTLLGIEHGRDLCTLITCTPYGVNSHRLLVCGSRIPYEEAEIIEEAVAEETEVQSTWENQYIKGILYGILIVILIVIISAIISAIRRHLQEGGNFER